jgi:hypothetical protein
MSQVLRKTPVLTPIMNVPSMQNGVVAQKTFAQVAQDRTTATAQATVGGTVTAGNTVSLTLSHPLLSGGAVSVTYTVQSGDSPASIAEGLASLLNGSAALQYYDIVALAQEATVTIDWPGPLGNLATLSASVSSGATETVTLAPSSGLFSGGGGSIIPVDDARLVRNQSVIQLYGGRPLDTDPATVQFLAQSHAPIK